MEQQLVTFKLGEEDFAIDIMVVQEIIKIPFITVVPNAPQHIKGVINIRGNVIPVIDLKTRFSLPEYAQSPDARIIVIQIKGKILGIKVDQVTEVLRLPEQSIEPPPPVAIGIESGYIKGVGKVGQRIIVLLEVEKIIEKEQLVSHG